MADHPVPSERARELVRGAFDPHVHVAPDFAPRRITDLELAQRCLELGLAGFGLKSHYTADRRARGGRHRGRARACGRSARSRSTTPSAASTRPPSRSPRARARGSSGCPPSAPRTSSARSSDADPDGKVPVWVRFELELRAAGVRPQAVPVRRRRRRAAAGAARRARVVARHDLVLATGHLSRDEIFAVVDAAVEAGVKTIVVTHPEFPSQRIARPTSSALAERGALMERAFTTAYTGKCSGTTLRGHARRRRAQHGLGQRPRAGLQPAGRGRAGHHGRPLPGGRLHRRGGPDHGRREHAARRAGVA